MKALERDNAELAERLTVQVDLNKGMKSSRDGQHEELRMLKSLVSSLGLVLDGSK